MLSRRDFPKPGITRHQRRGRSDLLFAEHVGQLEGIDRVCIREQPQAAARGKLSKTSPCFHEVPYRF